MRIWGGLELIYNWDPCAPSRSVTIRLGIPQGGKIWPFVLKYCKIELIHIPKQDTWRLPKATAHSEAPPCLGLLFGFFHILFFCFCFSLLVRIFDFSSKNSNKTWELKPLGSQNESQKHPKSNQKWCPEKMLLFNVFFVTKESTF